MDMMSLIFLVAFLTSISSFIVMRLYKENKMSNEIRFIDLFAGIGGFRYSFEKCGCKCVFSSEINENCRRVYLKNYGDMPAGDITQIDERIIPDFEILCAGFPCQPFSICGKKKGFEDTRGTLFFEICRIIKEKWPPVILLENVKHLVNHDKKRTFNIIISTLEDLGYNVSYRILNSKDFGVPQTRERIIIVATKNGTFDFDTLKKHPPIAIKDILEKDGNFDILPKETYTLIDAHYVHQQDSGLIFVGYRNKGTWKNGVRPNTEHLSRVHRQPNRIYSINGTHPTIPSQESSGRFWIYDDKNDYVRRLTLNEVYKLMGYPDTFKRDANASNAYNQAGNSVVIPMIYEVAKSIIEHGFSNGKKGNFGANNSECSKQHEFKF